MSRVELSDAKRKLLEKLLKGEATRQSLEAPLPPRAPGSPTPIAPSQQPIWLHSQMAGDARIYNETLILRFRGALEIPVLERTLNEMLRRHEALRTVFAPTDAQVVQAIYDPWKLTLPVVDLSAERDSDRERELLRLVKIDANRAFDLCVGPLLRAKVFRMAKNDYRLSMVIHHIVLDGVSLVNVFLPELAAIYEAYLQGKDSPLEEPPYQYADFAQWQRRFLDNDSASAQIAYWRERLSGPIPTLQLPIDRPRPANPSYSGDMETFPFPGELTGAVERMAKAEGVTPYTLLLAAFQALLFRYSGQNDMLLGTTVDNRQRAEFQNLIGFFVNTVVLRTHPSGELTFRQLLRGVEDTVLGAIANRDVPLDELIRVLHPQRDVASQPLFQVMFSFPPRRREAHPRWELTRIHSGATKFDLLLDIEDTAEGLVGNLIYDSGLFDLSTIRRIIDHFLRLLNGALHNPDATLAELPLTSEAERKLLVADWNGAQREVPATHVAALVGQRAQETPEAIAVECRGERMTYAELERRSDMFAWRLREAGVGPESLVAIRMARSCGMLAALIGVLKTGGAWLPVDPSLPMPRQQFLIEDGQAAVLLTERSMARDLKLDSVDVIFCDEATDTRPFPQVDVQPDGLAYIIYTSGSTGQPKGAEITQSAFLNLCLAVAEEPGFTAADTMLAFATLSFDAAISELFVPLVTGGRVVVATEEEQQDPVRLMARMAECGCTIMQATPATWRALVEAGWTGDSHLKVLSAGETLPRDLAQQLSERSAELWNMYGPTETTVYAVIHKVTAWDRAIPIGHPIANSRVWVLDRNHNLVPPGVAGEVYIGGEGLARGYRRRPELTAERFVSLPSVDSGRLYRTGDLARWLPNGTLEYLGRADNQVKIRGFRVELEEIEAALNQHPAVTASAVKAWPDASGNMALVAYVVAPEGEDVRSGLRAKLPHYMVPSQVVFMDALPLNSNGKVDRKMLPRPASEWEPVSELATQTEREMAAIWESVLERGPIGRNDNFFELGGHSLLVTRLIRNIELKFGRRISMASVFEGPTVQELALLIDSGTGVSAPPRVVSFPHAGPPPLFWMYAGPVFRELAAHIGDTRPFIAMSLSPEEEEGLAKTHTDTAWMEEAAGRLVRAVRARQPHGPYHLGGWCVAGTLAYEMAVQLEAAGEKVGTLVMLDSANYEDFQKYSQVQLSLGKIAWHGRRLLRMPGREMLGYVREHARGFFTRTLATSAAEQSAIDYGPVLMAAYSYKLKPYAGSILAISPEDRPPFADLRSSWRGAPVENLRIADVPGDHSSCMHEPHVAALAECITQALKECEESSVLPQRPHGIDLRRAIRG